MASGATVSSNFSYDVKKISQLAIQGDFELVRRLATAELVSKTDDNGWTVLMLVADSRATPIPTGKCIEYFLFLGADPCSTDEGTGDTAAHLAARRNHLRLLALLPFDAKWLQNWQGTTPLMEAALTGSLDCAKHLLHLLRQKRFNQSSNERRMQLLELTDFDGRTALDIANCSGHRDLGKLIEREMRFVLGGLGSICNQSESETAMLERLTNMVDASNSEALQEVATLNLDLCDLPAWWGQTALIRAAGNAKLNDAGLWQRLVQAGDPTSATVDGFSCLHQAACGANSVAVGALVGAGAPLNVRDSRGRTPLMVAARMAATEVPRTLLDLGANWRLADWQDKTALEIAEAGGRKELAVLLRRYKDKSFFDEPLRLPDSCCPFLERWDDVRLLGRGGFGEVHEVLTDRGIRCAAKSIKLPVQLGDQQEAVRKELDRSIESERNLCQLQHDNIVKFLYICQPELSVVVLFMELLEGSSLERFLDKKPLDEDTIRQFSCQICGALQYLHNRKPPVLHRDINCSNIIVLTKSRQIKLIDFGLSIKLGQSMSHVSVLSSTPKGTMNFMAPELLTPSADSDPVLYSRESDIWAFGCTVYQMASGRRPFADCSNMWSLPFLLDKHGPPALPTGCSAELNDFYNCCVARERKDRKSASDLLSSEFLAIQGLIRDCSVLQMA